MICPYQRMDRMGVPRRELDLKLRERDLCDTQKILFKEELADIKKRRELPGGTTRSCPKAVSQRNPGP
jgi:hypothetical protein